ncbi:hypothetical protein D3C79_762300 [compost metagenome]
MVVTTEVTFSATCRRASSQCRSVVAQYQVPSTSQVATSRPSIPCTCWSRINALRLPRRVATYRVKGMLPKIITTTATQCTAGMSHLARD